MKRAAKKQAKDWDQVLHDRALEMGKRVKEDQKHLDEIRREMEANRAAIDGTERTRQEQRRKTKKAPRRVKHA